MTTDTYLDKYLPYNNFVQLFEILHMALPEETMREVEDYESCKIQNYLADLLVDLGRNSSHSSARTTISVPPDPNRAKGKRAEDCKCNLDDFRDILNKQIKLSSRNEKVMQKI